MLEKYLGNEFKDSKNKVYLNVREKIGTHTDIETIKELIKADEHNVVYIIDRDDDGMHGRVTKEALEEWVKNRSHRKAVDITALWNELNKEIARYNFSIAGSLNGRILYITVVTGTKIMTYSRVEELTMSNIELVDHMLSYSAVKDFKALQMYYFGLDRRAKRYDSIPYNFLNKDWLVDNTEFEFMSEEPNIDTDGFEEVYETDDLEAFIDRNKNYLTTTLVVMKVYNGRDCKIHREEIEDWFRNVAGIEPTEEDVLKFLSEFGDDIDKFNASADSMYKDGEIHVYVYGSGRGCIYHNINLLRATGYTLVTVMLEDANYCPEEISDGFRRNRFLNENKTV